MSFPRPSNRLVVAITHGSLVLNFVPNGGTAAATAEATQAAEEAKRSSWHACQVIKVDPDQSEYTLEHEGTVQKRVPGYLVRKMLFEYYDGYTAAQTAKVNMWLCILWRCLIP